MRGELLSRLPSLADLVRYELVLFLLALGVVVCGQILSGAINTRGLLHGRIVGRKRGRDLYFSPERLQLLVSTVAAAGYYLLQMANQVPSGVIPEFPESWILVLAASNAVYLGGKAYTQPNRDLLRKR